MANYWDGYSMNGAGMQPMGMSGYPQPMMQQSYAPAPQPMQDPRSIKFVDGKVGAMAYQMPQGWQPGNVLALWDSQGPYIYLKSWNQMGMANKIETLEVRTVEDPIQNLPSGNMSGSDSYATKDDLNAIREEIRNLSSMMQGRGGNQSGGNQNGSSYASNSGNNQNGQNNQGGRNGRQ